MQIYVDNAATTKMSDKAIEAMIPYMKETYGNPSSLHSVGLEAKAALTDARARVAKCIGCEPDEIIFTSGGSEADNQAIVSAAMNGKKKGKNHIISTMIEHHAILHTLDALKKAGFEITLFKPAENGMITAEQVKEAIKDETALVTVMYANNEIGTVMPIAEIGAVCREMKVPFHTDAVQAVGHLPINVKEQNIDMLSCSAHKFHGPKGIGMLYAKKGIRLVNIINGGGQEKGKRAGTENLPAIMGMAAAMEDAVNNMEEHNAKIIPIRDHIIEGLSKIEHSLLNGDREKRLPGNVHFCFEGIEGESLLLLLDDKGICTSSGSACASGDLDPSHVLMGIGRPHEIAHGSVRISLDVDNTMEEADYIIKNVTEIVEYLRSISPIWHDLRDHKVEYTIK